MKYRLTLTLLTILSTLLISGMTPVAAADYDHTLTSKKITFEWKINGANIDIRLSAPTKGWVGVGFNPSKQMKDANFIIGYVKNGKVKVTDDYGKSNKTHGKDSKAGGKKDVTGISGSEENGATTIAFTIPLNSGDSKDKALDINADTTVLLAYGSGRDSFKSRHKVHEILNVNLASGAFKNNHKH